jgi:putative ABC transport system ATP-binding protein
MVTHEKDIADYTKRNVIFRDGQIISDVQINNPHSATKLLSELNKLQQQ